MNSAEYIDVLYSLLGSAVEEIKKERNNDVIIFIDELDRAKPDFALRTIEMFHHLQDELPTTLIYSVDLEQLNGIIKHYYGFEYNVDIFVHKVFDNVISLKRISKSEMRKYVNERISKVQLNKYVALVSDTMMAYMTKYQFDSLRTVNKLIDKLQKDFLEGYFENQYSPYYYYLGESQTGNKKGYVKLMVVLNVLRLNDPVLVAELLQGKRIDELMEFMKSNKHYSADGYINKLVINSYNEQMPKDMIVGIEISTDQYIIGLKSLFVLNTETEKKSVFEEF